MFHALAASMNFRVYAQDAFAHSPWPETPTYLAIDDAFAEWYEEQTNVTLDRSYVLPIQRALQGHPESGKLWEEHINRILLGPRLNFCTTTHDRTIYTGLYDVERVLLLRQVDDFSIACRYEETAKAIYDVIGKALQLPNESSPPFKYLGLQTDFNGIDVEQSSTHIGLSCSTYIP